ncbi:unnamed protein product [Rhizophagus irregularis]|nr:unnamed protein product [Rhizophagus irregularis]
MNSFSKSIDDNNILFEQFLGDNNSEEELEYDETFLEQLINQNSILLDAENIESNKQSNIFHIENFLWAHETVRSEEINEYNSSSDDEIDDDNEQNLKNESESLENEIYIMDEMSTSLSPCAIVDMIDGKLQTCGKPKFNCENDRLHDEDSDKILIALANWLLLVVKNESQDRKEIILTHMLNPALHFLQNITLSKNTKKNIDMESICNFEEIRRSSISSTTSTISSINTVYTGLTNYIQLPTLFMFQILLKMNKISNTISSELLISDEQWPDVGNKLAERIWKSREELNKQKAEIQNPASLENYYSAFPSYLTGFFGNLN